MALETTSIHPRTERKEVPGISSNSRQGIDGAIAKRLESAKIRAGYRDLLIRIISLALIVLVVFKVGFLISQNHGQMMAPAMKDGDLCVVFRTQAMSMTGQAFAAGDVVAYQTDGGRRFARVAAVAGDKVELSGNGYLSVNGTTAVGQVTAEHAQGASAYPLTVPQGSLYVLCDDRMGSQDSRDLGPIPLDRVEGKVITILRRRGI